MKKSTKVTRHKHSMVLAWLVLMCMNMTACQQLAYWQQGGKAHATLEKDAKLKHTPSAAQAKADVSTVATAVAKEQALLQAEIADKVTSKIEDKAEAKVETKEAKQQQKRSSETSNLPKSSSPTPTQTQIQRQTQTQSTAQKPSHLYITPKSQLTDLVDISGLSKLIHHAFAHNPNLQQTQLALQIAYKNAAIGNANRLPSLNAGLDVNRAKERKTNYTAKLNASWELDLWQKLATQREVAHADVLASAMQLQAAKDALVASMMRQYMAVVRDKKTLALQQQRVQKVQQIEWLITKRFRLGITSLSDLLTARQNTQQSKARLPEYRQNLHQSERVLLRTLGMVMINPAQAKAVLKAVQYDYPKVFLPLSKLPEQDLRRRPDLQQAYFAIRAAELNADVAYKNLLPSISLSGTLNTFANQPLKLLTAEPAWTLLGQLSAPIFNAGKLKNQANIAKLQAAQRYWTFQNTLLDAVTNITNAQSNEVAIRQRIQALNATLATSKKLVKSNQRLYPLGKVDVRAWLNSELTLYDLYEQHSQLIYAQCINRINLGLELGLGVYAKEKPDKIEK